MGIIKIKGLEGLKGFSDLSAEDQHTFYAQYKNLFDKLPEYQKETVASELYKRKQYIERFGMDAYKAQSDADIRNQQYREAVINEEWNRRFSPITAKGTIDKNKGMSYDDYQKYSKMSIDSKEKLLKNEDFLSIDELNNKYKEVHIGNPKGMFGATLPTLNWAMNTVNSIAKDRAIAKNKDILEKLYAEDVDKETAPLEDMVYAARGNNSIVGATDEETVKLYKQAITPGSYKGNMGISEWASHYGTGSEDDIKQGDMEDFSIEDMKTVLAKKAVYEQYLDPERAMTALNNDAKRWIDKHQGTFKTMGLWGRDVAIAMGAYTADKINGTILEPLYDAADAIYGAPTVLVSDDNQIISPTQKGLKKNSNGSYSFVGEDGKTHTAHYMQVGRNMLHLMGKEFNGSNSDEGVFSTNPLFWSRAEQTGTVDPELQKKYEKLGSSPYKVEYSPEDDTDYLYESTKMVSFALADKGATLVPWGIGAVGKGLQAIKAGGKVIAGAAKALNWGSKILGNPVTQGVAGAGGISYAYQRGATQDMLNQNMAALEETVFTRSNNEIKEQYYNDAEYKKQIDSQVDARAKQLKQQFLNRMKKEGNSSVIDSKALDRKFKADAVNEILGAEVSKRAQEIRNSDDYTKMQQEAYTSTAIGSANSFYLEGAKMVPVNIWGYRKWLYSSPTSLQKGASKVFKGLKEFTTEGGKQRLKADATEFLTSGSKWKTMGKGALKQVWGGAWTNGTDDMMVDASTKVSTDRYNEYLNQFSKGEAIADTYGFLEGVRSYWNGFAGSLGQPTTWDATAIGGLGSLMSASPNFANIASLATKSGREAFRKRFTTQVERDSEGLVKKDENGNPITKKLTWKDNWRDRFAFFVDNGIISDYYGKKQTMHDMQEHADFVNGLLDQYNDFEALENLVASFNGTEDADNIGDKKTMRLVQALNTVDALNRLAQSSSDPTALSSTIAERKETLKKIVSAVMDQNSQEALSEDEVKNLLTEYYSSNPSIPRTEANDQKALYQIAENAQKMLEASELYNKADEEIQKIEKTIGKPLNPVVKQQLRIKRALSEVLPERIEKMKEEIDDPSQGTEISQEQVLPSIGGLKRATSLQRTYEKQAEEIGKEITNQDKEIEELQKKRDKANEEYEKAKGTDKESDAQNTLKDSQAELDNAIQQKRFYSAMADRTQERLSQLKEAIATEEEAKKSPDYKEKVLTADEIFSMEPVARARMLDPNNRGLYSEEQQREIEKLENRLIMRGNNALQKVQDIALLTQRVKSNEDAYSRIVQNPDAAEYAYEAQKAVAAQEAHALINRRNAELLAKTVSAWDEQFKDAPIEKKKQDVYKAVRDINSEVLDILLEDNMLPQYKEELEKTKEWKKLAEDAFTVIAAADKASEWKTNMLNVVGDIFDKALTKEDALKSLEDILSSTDDTQLIDDLSVVVKGLKEINYLRNSTVVEDAAKRKQRLREDREREEAARKKIEEEKKRAEEEAKKKEEEKKKNNTEIKIIGDLDLGIDSEESKEDEEAAKEDSKEGSAEKPKEKPSEGKKVTKKELNKNEPSTIEERIIIRTSNNGEYQAFGFDPNKGGDKNNTRATKFWRTRADTRALRNPKTGNRVQDDAANVYIPLKDGTSVITYFHDKDGRIFGRRDGTGINVWRHLTPEEVKEIQEGLLNNNFKTFEEMAKFVDKVLHKELPSTEQKASPSEVSKEASPTTSPEVTNDTISDNSAYVEDKGETVEGKAPTLEEQNDDNSFEEREATSTADNGNTRAEELSKAISEVLNANVMSEWNSAKLSEEGILEHKKGAEADDAMNKSFAWMKNAGHKLQNVIDYELSEILKVNPHAKVKFMVVRPEKNATHDVDMQKHLMLVLDYDNSINKDITNIHNADNGCVVEAGGKKYLMIGVAGFAKGNAAQMESYDILFNPYKGEDYGKVRKGLNNYFKEHPTERFFVHPTLETEVVPGSIIPGWRVKQLETDSKQEYRSVFDLLSKERNPYGLTRKELSFGIQENQKFLVVNGTADVMVPRNRNRNLGNVFVLVPASNGRMLPLYVRPLVYKEMRDGALKNKVTSLLSAVLSPNYQTRLDAVISLAKIFYFNSKEGNNIVLRKNSPIISLIRDGKIGRAYNLDIAEDRQAFMQGFEEMNPIVNITKQVLSDEALMKEYDEAGAFMTDAAVLGTAGSSYTVFAIDKNGNMVKPANLASLVERQDYDASYINEDRTQVIRDGKFYLYDKKSDTFYLETVPIKDAKLIEELRYNISIEKNSLIPVEEKGNFEYYILSEGEHPEVIKRNRTSYKVTRMDEAKAKEYIDKINKQREDKAREEAAKESIEITNTQDLDGLLDNEEDTIEETAEKSTTEQESSEQPLAEKTEATPKQEEKPAVETPKTPGQSFTAIMGKPKYMFSILSLIKAKFPDAPSDIKKMSDFLKGKGIEVDDIGTSDEDVKVWIDTIRNCR